MSKILICTIVIILTLSLVYASDFCPNCYQSTVTFVNYNPTSSAVKVHCTYQNVTFSEIKETNGKPSEIQTKHMKIVILNVPNATLEFKFDGQPIMDGSGRIICNSVLSDDDGYASCNAQYARNPDGSGPMLISNWSHDALMTARLIRSTTLPKLKPSMSSVLIATGNTKVNKLYPIFLQAAQNNLGVCLPFSMLLGLLIASMYYAGKNPLSLFDITTPRLPQARKVRMQSPTAPMHLAAKGRMATRIINRSDKALSASILALYGRQRSSDLKKKIRKAMGPQIHKIDKDPKALEKSINELKKIINNSGADSKRQQMVIARMMRLMQIREALALDKKLQGQGRSSKGMPEWKTKVNPTLDFLGRKIARPWKLIPAIDKSEHADKIPGIPFVEKASLIAQTWWGGRLGNLAMRRGIYKTLAAETAVALRLMSKENSFAAKNLFEMKKMGEIPLILERLRFETHILGKAISEEQLRIFFANQLMLKEDKDGKYSGDVSSKGIEKFFKLKHDAMKIVEQKIKDYKSSHGKDSSGNTIIYDERSKSYLINYELAKLIHKTYTKNANGANALALFDHNGKKLDDKIVKDLLSHSILYIEKSLQILQRDNISTKKLLAPKTLEELNSREHNKDGRSPEQVFKDYSDMTDLLSKMTKNQSITYKFGRDNDQKTKIPMVMLGHDLSKILGQVTTIHGGAISEDFKLLHTRLRIEAELSKKHLFDYVMGSRKISDSNGVEISPLEIGKSRLTHSQWVDNVTDAANVDKIRVAQDTDLRGRWAAKNHLTAYNTISSSFVWETERNKINTLKQMFSYAFDKSYESLFQSYNANIERNKAIFYSMKATCKFYTGNDFDSEGYEKWKDRGVNYGDIKRGIWLIGADKTITPIPSKIIRDKNSFNITGAEIRREENNKKLLSYDSSVFSLLVSDYAERPVNASMFFKTDGKEYKQGLPKNREVMNMLRQLGALREQLSNASDSKSKTDDMSQQIDDSARNLSKGSIIKNIQILEKNLNDRMKIATRTSILDDPHHSSIAKMSLRGTMFLERAFTGGVNTLDERLHDWYSAQSYTRVVLASFKRDFEKTGAGNELLSEEVKTSLLTKNKLMQERQRQAELLQLVNPTLAERNELNSIRLRLPDLIRNMHRNEEIASRASKIWGDRAVQNVSKSFVPMFNVMEQTVMRDPRITFGSAYGLGPAMMTGYQTGQFVGERPQMWAGYHLMPGDRAANVLSRAPYAMAMAFGAYSRTFFTKLTGYTSIYHMDPDKGIKYGSHEQGMADAFQSLAKPSQSFDWFTRFFPKSFKRTKGQYKDEFGYRFVEEDSWHGSRWILPWSWKGSGSEMPYETDVQKYKLKGYSHANEERQRKLGLTFNDMYSLWNKRDLSSNQDQIRNALKHQLKSSTNNEERQMINHLIRESRDIENTSRKIWKIPIVGAFFKQGYYAVEGRSGYDPSAVGAALRQREMNAWEKNIADYATPGMFYKDYDSDWQVYPRVSRSILRAHRPNNTGTLIGNFNNAATPESAGGLGRDLLLDSTKDVYKHETSLISHFLDVEQQRLAFTFYNTPYMWFAAPLYFTGYFLLKKHSKTMRAQNWSTDMPELKDEGKYTNEELKREKTIMQNHDKYAKDRRTNPNTPQPVCPLHGIDLPPGSPCPLCRSKENMDLEESNTWYRRFGRTKGHNFKALAQSFATLGSSKGKHYTEYFNQAHCQTHQIAYSRGGVCPSCVAQTVKNSGFSNEDKTEFKTSIKSYNDQIYKVGRSSLSDLDKGEKISKIVDDREHYKEQHRIKANHDVRMGYNDNYYHIQHQLKLIAQEEEQNKFGFKTGPKSKRK